MLEEYQLKEKMFMGTSKKNEIFSKQDLPNYLLKSSAAKPNPFFRVQPNFRPTFRVQTGRVGPQDPKTGPIGSG